jgi:hypothetical protein
MADGKRPGGLTALAVINFVFAALLLLGIAGLVFFLFGGLEFLLKMAKESGSETDLAEAEKLAEKMTPSLLITAIALSAVQFVLMIASGIGYLKQKLFLGRKLGNAYAVVAIGTTIFGIAMAVEDFSIMTMIDFIYPILTLFLLNVTFKDDLVR